MFTIPLRLVATALILFTTAASLSFTQRSDNCMEKCTSKTFETVTLFGGLVLGVTPTRYTNLSFKLNEGENHYAMNVTGLDVCEVVLTYTHPGQNDMINTTVWLPTQQSWNGRFMGVGGGGWATSSGNTSLAWPASQGFAAVTTDGGHGIHSGPDVWALKSPGNVDWALLQDFASIALDDAATLGKAVVQGFYGEQQRYSYWSGCSTGGRQGHMMAQRYPKQYDGILATASAFNWAQFIPSEYWPQVLLNTLGEYPDPCEIEAITQAAVAACDSLDGIEDNIIARPGLCRFDPESVVGQTFTCLSTGQSIAISSTGAALANATWAGPSTQDGKFEWFGLNQDAILGAPAGTNCSTGTCVGQPFSIAEQWIQYFIRKDPSFEVMSINRTNYDEIFRQSVNQYDSIIGTSDPDLTDFREAGGKLITWHGLADQLIPPNGTLNYYQRVLSFDPGAAEYYRFFEAPGVYHCGGGPGWYPGSALESLIQWVENGTAPETLEAIAMPGTPFRGPELRTANLCAWPKASGGDINVASSFSCE